MGQQSKCRYRLRLKASLGKPGKKKTKREKKKHSVSEMSKDVIICEQWFEILQPYFSLPMNLQRNLGAGLRVRGFGFWDLGSMASV